MLFMVETAVVGQIAEGRRQADWPIFSEGARNLFGHDGLAVLGRHDELIIGPVALAVVQGFRLVGGYKVMALVLGAVGPLLVYVLERMTPGDRKVPVFIGGALFSVTWADLVLFGHVEDVLTLSCAVVILWATRNQRPVVAGVALGVALCSKQWALVLAPLLFALPRRDAIRAGVIASGIAVVAWLPLIVADSRTIQSATQNVSPDSVMHLFGFDGITPGWWRAVQLLAALGLATWVALRGNRDAVFLVAVTSRVALDPSTWGYYSAGVLLAALAYDLTRSSKIPWWTVAAFFTIAEAHTFTGDTGLALLRLGFFAAVLVESHRPQDEATGDRPRSHSNGDVRVER